MATEHKTDYVAEGAQLLRQAHRGKPKTVALMSAFMDVCQGVEDAMQTLVSPYDLEGAAGDKLDRIGSLLGAERDGLDDGTFRLLIRGRIAARHADGTLRNLLAVAKALYQAKEVYAHAPTSEGAGPACDGGQIGIMVGSPALPASLWPTAKTLLVDCLPAGVDLGFFGTFNADQALALAGTRAWVGGLGSTKNPSIGAPLASVDAA